MKSGKCFGREPWVRVWPRKCARITLRTFSGSYADGVCGGIRGFQNWSVETPINRGLKFPHRRLQPFGFLPCDAYNASMALWNPDIPCPLCGQPVGSDERLIIGFTCLGSYDPDVAVIDDAVVHQACLDDWERRDYFVSAWNAEAAQNDRTSRYWLEISSGGHVHYSNA
jgi:hypothetical protein